MRVTNYLVIFFAVLIISCDDDGSLYTGPSDSQESFNNDLSGYGCSNSTLCYPLDEVYYNFSDNNAISQIFFKYNLIDIVTGNYSDLPANQLELNSFNSSYFAAVPSSSITSGNEEDEVIVVNEEGDYIFETQLIVTLSEVDNVEKGLSSDLELVSNNFNVIDYVIWDPGVGRYSFVAAPSKRDTTKYIFSQKYDSLSYTTLIDTILTPIYGDIVLVDENESVYRYYALYDSLLNESDIPTTPIRAKRRMDYKIKDTYVPTDGLMFRNSTDCNDNYRKDSEEIVIFSGYNIDSAGTDADSFQFWCENQNGLFTIDSENLCSSACTIDENSVSMSEFCVDEYENDGRMTGACYTVTNLVDQIVYEGGPGESDDMSYPMTFCDRGNNLFDSTPEYYLDQDNDGQWSLIGQNYEPFEDRNCNGFPDGAENINGCDDLSFDESLGINFCDEGNRIWDNAEKCYSSAEECDYTELYSKADAPDVMMVTYESGQPLALESAYPSGDFFDTGADGCFNELEDGNGGCLCEFMDTDGDDNLNSTQPYDIPPCNNFSLSDGEVNFSDLDDDGLITILDVAASLRSPFDYGTCSNGFSGSYEDCCEYYLCDWDGSSCDWSLSAMDVSLTFCSNDMMISCTDDSDCDGGSCTEIKWSENTDPNQDDGIDESNGFYEIGEMTEEYIDDSTNETIGYETYFSDLNTFIAYEPYIKNSDYIVTKELDYGASDQYGGDTIPVISDSLRLVTVIESSPIIKSNNMVESKNVIDQINLNEDVDLSELLDEDLIDYYNNVLSEYHIIKTDFENLDGQDDYDYMLFKKSDTHVVKMIHPYYHFTVTGGAVNPPLDDNNLPEEIFWQSINLDADTLLYSYDGNIVEGQSFYSFNTVESDTANYNIRKEYLVTRASADLNNGVLDPNCILYNTEETCGDDGMYWCVWNEGECQSDIVTNIPDCLLVTRTVTTTSVGSGLTMELISRTYLKPGYKIVKQDISILWDDMPWVSSSETPFSIMEYKTPEDALDLNSNSSIFGNSLIEVEDFENNNDFNYSPFRITNTMGLQRLELPSNE